MRAAARRVAQALAPGLAKGRFRRRRPGRVIALRAAAILLPSLLLLVACVAATGVPGQASGAARIAVVVPEAAAEGAPSEVLAGARLAAAALTGGGRPLELAVVRDRGPGRGSAVVREVRGLGAVAAILAVPLTRARSLAADLVAAEIVTFSVGTSSSPTSGRRHVFLVSPSDTSELGALLDEIQRRGKTRLGVLHERSAYGEEALAALREEAGRHLALRIVKIESFAADAAGAGEELANVFAERALALLVLGEGPAAPRVVAQVRKLRIRELPIAVAPFPTASGFATGEGAAQGAAGTIAASYLDPRAPSAAQAAFLDAYRGAYGTLGGASLPPLEAACGWEAVALVAAALDGLAADEPLSSDAVLGLRDFSGVFGARRFTAEDRSGLRNASLSLVELLQGGWAPVGGQGR